MAIIFTALFLNKLSGKELLKIEKCNNYGRYLTLKPNIKTNIKT